MAPLYHDIGCDAHEFADIDVPDFGTMTRDRPASVDPPREQRGHRTNILASPLASR